MADIRINQLPVATGPTAPVANDAVAIDGSTTRRTTIAELVSIGRPIASQAEAEAGTDPAKAMTPLTTKQSVASEVGVSVLAYSDNLQGLSLVVPGDAGRSILGSSLASDVRDFLDAPLYVQNRTSLKAINPTKDLVCFLREDGREGVFKWVSGNFTARVALDTAEGIYVKADAVAASSGAWVRQFNGSLKPEWFGALGTGADDTAAILIMVAVGELGNFSPSYKFSPWKEYGVSQKILFSAANTSFDTNNARFVVVASNAGSVFEAVLDIRTAGFSASQISIRRASGVSWPRLINGTNVSGVRISTISLDGAAPQVGYTGASNSAINLNLFTDVRIGLISSKNHDRVIWLDAGSYISIERVDFRNTLRGMQYNDVTNFYLGGGEIVGGSASEVNGAGENAIVVGGNCSYGVIKDVIGRNQGEHTYRVTGSADFGMKEIYFKNIASYNAGRSGVKCASGTIDEDGGASATPHIMAGLYFDGVIVEDCGRAADLAWIAAGMTGTYGTANEYAFVATNVNNIFVRGLKCKLSAPIGTGAGQRQYAGLACLRIRSVSDGSFMNLDLHGAKDQAILVQDTYRGITGVKVEGGWHVDGGGRMLHGVDINCPNTVLRDLYLVGGMIKACTTTGVLLRSLAGAPPQPVVLDALVVNCPVGLNDSGSAFSRIYKRVTLLGTS